MAKVGSGVSQRISVIASVSSINSLAKAVSALTSVGAFVRVGMSGSASRVVSVVNSLKGVHGVSAALSIRGRSPVK